MTLKTDTEIICLPFPEFFFMLFYLFTGSNRMSTSLEMHVRLKLKAKALA